MNSQFYNCLEPLTYAMFCRAAHVDISGVSVLNCRGGLMCDFSGTNDFSITGCTFEGGEEGLAGVFFDRCGGNIVGCQFFNLGAVGISYYKIMYLKVFPEIQLLSGRRLV